MSHYNADQVRGLIRNLGETVPKQDVRLLMAIAWSESRFDVRAMRFEPAWKYFVNVNEHALDNGITIATETALQQFSYGLMQVMGSVARELGFTGHLLDLLNPVLNIQMSYNKIKDIRLKYSEDKYVISAYNCGTPKIVNGCFVNQNYVDTVLHALDKF